MRSTNHDEAKRTSPLALWRYAHDYLRAAQALCRQHRIACRESQAPYHVASEGLTFTVKAYLRTKGATMAELDRVIGRSLTEALIRGEAQGLPADSSAMARCRRRRRRMLPGRSVRPSHERENVVRRRGAPGRLRSVDPRPHRARRRGALRPASRRGCQPVDAGIRRPPAGRSPGDVGHRGERELVRRIACPAAPLRRRWRALKSVSTRTEAGGMPPLAAFPRSPKQALLSSTGRLPARSRAAEMAAARQRVRHGIVYCDHFDPKH